MAGLQAFFLGIVLEIWIEVILLMYEMQFYKSAVSNMIVHDSEVISDKLTKTMFRYKIHSSHN